MPAICCGLAPLLFGGRPLKLVQVLRPSQKSKVPKNQKKTKGSRKDMSSQPSCNFILMMELRKKIMIFRDIIDLPPCSTAVSTDQLLLGTLKDLQKFYPGSIPHFRGSELKGLAFDKVLIYFCKALQALGDTSNTGDEWIDKYKYDKYKNGKRKNVDKLVEIAVAKLNGLIKIAREKFDMMDEDEENKDLGPKGNSFGKVLKDSYSDNSSGCPSPATPTSVLPEVMNGSPKSPYSSSLLLSLRVQAVGKLNPIDVKRLTLHMLPNVGLLLPSCLNQKKIGIEELKEEAKDNSAVIKQSIVDETRDSNSQNETSEYPVSNSDSDESNTAPPKFSQHVALTPPPSPRQPPKLSINMEVAEEKSLSPPATPAGVSSPPPSPQQVKLSTDMETDIGLLPSPPASSAEVSSPPPSTQQERLSTDMETDIGLVPLPPASSAEVLSPPPQPQPTKLSTAMEIDISSLPTPPPPPPPSFLRPNVVSGVPPLQPNVEAAQPTLLTTEPELPSPVSTPSLTSTAATGIALPPPPPPPAPLKSNVVATGVPVPPPPPAPLKPNVVATGVPVPPPPPAPLKPNVVATGAPVPPPPPAPLKPYVVATGAPVPPPPPASLKSNVVATGAPVPPPPPISLHSKVMATKVPVQPPPTLVSGSGSGISPPPLSLVHGAAPSPPPPPAAKSLRPKKASTKLKRSSHMGTLYRVLKGKVEGFPVQGKSLNGKKSGVVSSPSGKQGMADALAEMTKRSAYFQQIEGDVEKYAKSITELKTAITKFNAKDMTELLKFHKHVESILEKLTDESQVLARFEGFPTKKLEALRTASALYSRLESMIAELQNWKIEPPLAQLLNKVERYFNKVKEEVDALERTKDEESKKFKSYNIDFDFQIFVRIKEAMVDVSSNCMELALKERREAKLAKDEGSKTNAEAQQKVCNKMLWRAFQFAFRVYTFAGGHDERADKLTRELAHEIETDEHQ